MIALKRILSYVFIIPEFQFESEYSGTMDVRWEKGRLALNSPEANYSYNLLHSIMRTSLQHMLSSQTLQNGPVLNLGMGAGSTVSILREELLISNPIVSVEYDMEIIKVARSHFNIERFKDHTVIHRDAGDFIRANKTPFALIIVDLFKDKKVDAGFLASEFIEHLCDSLLPGGGILFNYIGKDHHPAETKLGADQCEVLKIGENSILIYWKTDRS